MRRILTGWIPGFLIALLFIGGSLQAADPAVGPDAGKPALSVASGPAGEVSAAELEAEVERRVPEKDRLMFWGMSHVIEGYVESLYVYRALAGRARAEGFRPATDVDAVADGASLKASMKRDRELVTAWLQRQARDAMPDEDAVRAWARSEYNAYPERYVAPEQAHLRHIMLRTRPDDTDEQVAAVKKRAEELLEQLKGGADFEILAREYSQDEGSASRGGDLGVGPRQQWVETFSDAAFVLRNPGELAGPVQTEFGWHVIELVEYEAERPLTFEEAMPRLRQQLEARLGLQEQKRVWDEVKAEVVMDRDALQALAGRHIHGQR